MKRKEEIILNEIIKYTYENHTMPTRRYLQKKCNYKSVNSITRYIKILEEENYLIRNKDNKIILNDFSIFYNCGLKTIDIINSNNKTINLLLDKNDKYLAYKIHNNFFHEIGIFRNDILIIKKKKWLRDNEIGLFIIDNKYRIMKYSCKDGFYILKDKEEILLNNVKIIGKVIMIERKLWDIPKF